MIRRRIASVAALAIAAIGLGCAAWWSVHTVRPGTAGTGTVDALIVFGSPAETNGDASRMQLWRVREAVAEYQRGRAAHLIFTGGAAANKFVEADVMSRAAMQMGVAPDAILLERHSRTTIENVRGVSAIMQAHGWTSAELISSADHLPRIAVIAHAAPFQWRLHPAPTPGRRRLAVALATSEESLAILLLRTIGPAAEPLIHAVAVCEHWLFFLPKWLMAKLLQSRHQP